MYGRCSTQKNDPEKSERYSHGKTCDSVDHRNIAFRTTFPFHCASIDSVWIRVAYYFSLYILHIQSMQGDYAFRMIARNVSQPLPIVCDSHSTITLWMWIRMWCNRICNIARATKALALTHCQPRLVQLCYCCLLLCSECLRFMHEIIFWKLNVNHSNFNSIIKYNCIPFSSGINSQCNKYVKDKYRQLKDERSEKQTDMGKGLGKAQRKRASR